MRPRTVKKNNPELLKRKGSGFFGRILAVQFGNDFIAIQNVKGKPKEEAVIGYADRIFADEEISAVQRIYLKRYKRELLKIHSRSELPDSEFDGKYFTKHLLPVDNQLAMVL